jgi:hypothetical protein
MEWRNIRSSFTENDLGKGFVKLIIKSNKIFNRLQSDGIWLFFVKKENKDVHIMMLEIIIISRYMRRIFYSLRLKIAKSQKFCENSFLFKRMKREFILAIYQFWFCNI